MLEEASDGHVFSLFLLLVLFLVLRVFNQVLLILILSTAQTKDKVNRVLDSHAISLFIVTLSILRGLGLFTFDSTFDNFVCFLGNSVILDNIEELVTCLSVNDGLLRGLILRGTFSFTLKEFGGDRSSLTV